MANVAPLNYGLAGTSRYANYYKHSGRLNPGAVVISLVAGVVAAAILGTVYAAAVIFIPFIKLLFVICLFFGLCLGGVTAGLLQRFKVRNTPVGLLVAAAVGVAGLYCSWVAWEAILQRNAEQPPSPLGLLVRPDEVVRKAQAINETGTWSLGGNEYNHTHSDAMSGMALGGVWLLEAVTIIGGAVATAGAMMRSKPFCEQCDQWCGATKLIRQTALADPKTVRDHLEAGDFAYVANLGPAAGSEYLEFNRQSCEKCGQLNALTVSSRNIVTDKQGKVRSNRAKPFVKQLLIAKEDLPKLSPAPATGATVATSPQAGR